MPLQSLPHPFIFSCALASTLGACSGEPTPASIPAELADATLSPGLRWLADRNEPELSALFATAQAGPIPLGANRGTPLLPPPADALTPLAVKLYQGSTWTQDRDGEGRPLFQPNGDPRVSLTDQFGSVPEGGLITLFRGEVTRGSLADVRVAWQVAPPTGTSRPHWLSPFGDPIVIDGRPSLFVDYSRDATPVVNRILDEIRAVDAADCPGLYLGRAHYLDSVARGTWVYLYWFALDFGPTDRACDLGLRADL